MPDLGLTLPCQQAKPWAENDVRPIYVFLGDDSTGAARTCYMCPFCEEYYRSRKACEKHIGMVMNVPAGCPVLKKTNSDRERFVRQNFGKIKKEHENGKSGGL